MFLNSESRRRQKKQPNRIITKILGKGLKLFRQY